MSWSQCPVGLPVFNEEANLRLLHSVLCDVTEHLTTTYDVRFVYVDDGSVDASREVLREIAGADDRVTVIELSRNFGHQIAVTAALDHAESDAVIIMDADMQDPPRVSLELVEQWERGVDVVYAQRRTRTDSRFKVATAALFYRFLRSIAEIDIPADTGDFRLLDRRVVLELRKFREHDRFMRGLVSWVGFRQMAVPFDRDGRHAGRTGYTFRRMAKLAAAGILGFSTAPLRLISRFGFLVSALSVLGAVYALGTKILVPEAAVPGWAFLASGIFFLGGVQIVMLGVLGSYIGRTYTEVQRRPLYSVAEVHGVSATRPGTYLGPLDLPHLVDERARA